MIDNLTLLLTHGLLAIALVRLMLRPDLDSDIPPEGPGGAEDAAGAGSRRRQGPPARRPITRPSPRPGGPPDA